MAHTGIFATKAECDAKAGENIDATGWTEANINLWCLEAESYINCLCRYNFSDAFAALNADIKYILSEAASNIVAIYGIQFNMAGYSSRIEAEDMINLLWARTNKLTKLLEDQKVMTFMKGA